MDIAVSEIGLGTWGFDSRLWKDCDLDEALRTCRAALAGGVNFIDTAHAYGNGVVEQWLGEVLRVFPGRRHIHVATKVPPAVPIHIPSPQIHADEAFPAAHIRRHTERSLQSLGVERLALQQLHVWSPMWLHEGEWLETLHCLRREGKIAGFGVSLHDHDAESGVGLVESGSVDSIQVLYNLFDQLAASTLFPACRRHGVGVIIRSPLYEGALSGSWQTGKTFHPDDWRAMFFAAGHLEETIARAAHAAEDLTPADESLADLALRFSLSEPAVSTVIVGMRNLEHLRANIRVSNGPVLSFSQLRRLRRHDWLS